MINDNPLFIKGVRNQFVERDLFIKGIRSQWVDRLSDQDEQKIQEVDFALRGWIKIKLGARIFPLEDERK
jgi:hypothetical protein